MLINPRVPPCPEEGWVLPAGTCLRTPLSPSSCCPLPSLHPPCSPSPPQGPPQPLHTRIPTGNGAAPPLPQPWRTPGPRCIPQPLFPLGWGTSQPCGTSASRGGFQRGSEVCRSCFDRVLVSKARGVPPPPSPPPPQTGRGRAGDANEAPHVCTTLQK